MLLRLMWLGAPLASGADPVCIRADCSSGLPQCAPGNLVERWLRDFDAGDRLSYMTRYGCRADGSDCVDSTLAGRMARSLRCVVKGPGGKGVPDMTAYVEATMDGSNMEFHTKRPCAFHGLPVGHLEPELLENTTQGEEEGNESGAGDAAQNDEGTRRRLQQGELLFQQSCSILEELIAFYQAPQDDSRQADPSCAYPPLPADEEILRQKPPGWPTGLKYVWEYQFSFIGPRFQVSSVNGEAPGSSEFDVTEELEEYLIDFGQGNVSEAYACDDAQGIAREGNSDASAAFYDGGLQVRSKRGSYLTQRMYQFKNHAQRDAALAAAAADPSGLTNPGLQHAHLVEGMHGCDVELVFEVTPAAGGGLDLVFGFPLFAYTVERTAALVSATAAWVSGTGGSELGEALHVVVSKRALETAQNLPCSAQQPDDVYVELAAFAMTFVCGATGERVTATMSVSRADGSWLASEELSRDPEQPTPYRAARMGQPAPWSGPHFHMTLNEEQAPESCGVMYFDPVLRPSEGDGLVYKTRDEDASGEGPPFANGVGSVPTGSGFRSLPGFLTYLGRVSLAVLLGTLL